MLKLMPLWTLPLGMVALNVVGFTMALMFERRVKITMARFAILYASTLPAARRGDLGPFFQIFTMTA